MKQKIVIRKYYHQHDGQLSHRTNPKVGKSLSVTGPSGLSKQYRDQIGLSLSKIETVQKRTKNTLCCLIEEYFSRPDVTKLCPDKKKVVADPFDCNVTMK